MIDEQKLKAIARRLGLDVPILRAVENGNRLTLYLYGGGEVEIQLQDSAETKPVRSSKDGSNEPQESLAPATEDSTPPKAARKRRNPHGHD